MCRLDTRSFNSVLLFVFVSQQDCRYVLLALLLVATIIDSCCLDEGYQCHKRIFMFVLTC